MRSDRPAPIRSSRSSHPSFLLGTCSGRRRSPWRAIGAATRPPVASLPRSPPSRTITATAMLDRRHPPERRTTNQALGALPGPFVAVPVFPPTGRRRSGRGAAPASTTPIIIWRASRRRCGDRPVSTVRAANSAPRVPANRGSRRRSSAAASRRRSRRRRPSGPSATGSRGRCRARSPRTPAAGRSLEIARALGTARFWNGSSK